jgi:Flagellar hook-length control protein FliK
MNAHFPIIGYATSQIRGTESNATKNDAIGYQNPKQGFDRHIDLAEKKLLSRRLDGEKSNSGKLACETISDGKFRGVIKLDTLHDDRVATEPETENEEVGITTTTSQPQNVNQATLQLTNGFCQLWNSKTPSGEVAGQVTFRSSIEANMNPQISEKPIGAGQTPSSSIAVPADTSACVPKRDADFEMPVLPNDAVRAKTQVILEKNLSKHSEISAATQENFVHIKVEVVKTESQFNFGDSISSNLGTKIVQNLSAKSPETIGAYVTPKFELRPALTKTLNIQLHPESLGGLKVSMSLRGKELEIKIEASLRETAVTLSRDRKLLKDFVESAGYELGEKSVMISFNPDQKNFTNSDSVGHFGNQNNFEQNQFSGMNFAERRDADRDIRRDKKYEPTNSIDPISVDQKFNKIDIETLDQGIFI